MIKTKKVNYQGGFGMELLMVLVALFIIWVLMGGSKYSDQANKPYINPYNNNSQPLKTYGPNEAH